MARARPEPGAAAAPGYEHVAVVDPAWRILPQHTRGCRSSLGLPRGRSCGAPAVVEQDRGYQASAGGRRTPGNWWAYCPDHMTGRWVEAGTVMRWTVRRIGRESA